MPNPRFLVLAMIVFSGAMMRLIPHPPNFTPIAAIALFGGAHFASRRTALTVTLLAMFLSDLILAGGYHTLMPVVYGCFAMTVLMGRWIRRSRSILAIGGVTLSASLLFFIVTNFGVWVCFDFYPKTLAGLGACYAAAIPFFQNTLGGDLFFTTILLGGFALAQRRVPSLNACLSAQ